VKNAIRGIRCGFPLRRRRSSYDASRARSRTTKSTRRTIGCASARDLRILFQLIRETARQISAARLTMAILDINPYHANASAAIIADVRAAPSHQSCERKPRLCNRLRRIHPVFCRSMNLHFAREFEAVISYGVIEE
jgi:hypothetical protein